MRRPHDLAGIGDRAILRTDVRDAEVRHERAARARLEQDVVRLHVAVHDAAPVRVRQRPGDLAHDAHRVRGRQRAPRAQSFAECLALHVAHDEEHEPARLTDAMDRHDVRVRKASRRPCLAHEALARLGGPRHRRGQDLDRYVAVELHVAGEIDDAHAAAAELALEGVLACEGRLKLEEFGGGLRHPFLERASSTEVSSLSHKAKQPGPESGLPEFVAAAVEVPTACVASRCRRHPPGQSPTAPGSPALA